MAHKNLRGCKKPKRESLRKQIKKEKEKKQQKRKRKQDPDIEENANPLAGLRKWQKKALRAEKDQKEAAQARKAADAVKAQQKKAPPVQDAAPGEGAKTPAAKKELRMRNAQLRQNRKLYQEPCRILLVGEGNFSFGRALCQVRGSGEGIYATAFDGEASLKRKYADAPQMRQEIEEAGGTTLVGVDATRIHKVKEFREAFRIVVWNFPHMGAGEKDVEKSIEKHRQLLAEFFASAVRCLDSSPSAAIHVALKAGEPYKSWKIVQVAKAASGGTLQLSGVSPFSLAAWPGYEHRRTRGFHEKFSKKDSEELAKGAKVYVFVRGAGGDDDEADADEAASEA